MSLGIWPSWAVYSPPSAKKLSAKSGFNNTVRDVAREVLSAISGLTLLGPKCGLVWRGQASAAWRLESKMGRLSFSPSEMKQQELAMLREARSIGADNAQHLGDWEILARLRHHGAATRLIDFTTDPLVALWFLCDDDSVTDAGPVREEAGVLIAMQRKAFGSLRAPYARNYSLMFKKPAAVLLYQTPPIDPRIAAQRGMFALATHPMTAAQCVESELGLTVPNSTWRKSPSDRFAKVCDTGKWSNITGRPIETFPELMGIEVPAPVKPVLLEVLERSYGFTRSTIFPDFAGLGQAFAGRRH